MQSLPLRLRAFFLCLITCTTLAVACGGGGDGDGAGGGADDGGTSGDTSATDTGVATDDGGVTTDGGTKDGTTDDVTVVDADDAGDAASDADDAADVVDAGPDVMPDALPSPDGSSNLLPVVVVTGPANNTFAAAPATFTITVNASDVDGTVTKVELFSGATLLATFATGSVSYDWKNVPAGTYTITAVATDDQGGKQTSAPVTLVVDAPPTVSLTSPGPGFLGTAATSTMLSADAADSDGTVVAVDFYEGSNLLGTATSAPYTLPWSVLLPGSYTLTAKATDDQGVTTTSAPVTVLVNAAPTVVLTSPAAGTVSVAPGSFAIAASAVDTDGTITKVELFAGLKLLATKNAPPYTFNWNNVPAGTYALTARATDNRGAIAVSTPVTVYSNVAPTVSISAPTSGTVVVAPGPVTIAANAADADGSVVGIDVYADATLLGSIAGSTGSIDASGLVSGTYKLTAVATDNHGTQTTSAQVSITVDNAPTVSITAPAAGLFGDAPATTTITANATDSDGTIASVSFYVGSTFLGADVTAPYSVAWSSVPAGTYALKAVAKDNLGVTTTSSIVTVTINAPPTVAITAPGAGSLGTTPVSTTITANAADSDGSITQVAFYAGATLLGVDATAPYSFAWNNVAAGSYALKAVATDDSGSTTTSATVNVTVNAPPTVSITAPAAGTLGTGPYSTTITASASDSDGTIAQVAFYAGATLIGTDVSSPFSIAWNNVPAGNYALTAVAKDNSGATTTSAAVNVTINAAPTVSITAPAAGSLGTAPASTTITANAADSDGTIAQVAFYAGATLLGTDATAPYSFAWNNIASGTYVLKAVATDSFGATTNSSTVTVTVNAAPSVTITAPSAGLLGTAPVSKTITATATDADGTIAQVAFYADGVLLGTDSTAPYSFAWNNVAAGSYDLTAVAKDNTGATTTSATVTVTVNAPPTVSITAPAGGPLGNAPASTTIAASVADSDGTVTSVAFYVDGALLGMGVGGGPGAFTYGWSNIAAGVHSVKAVATDNNGAQTTSSTVVVSVNAPPTVTLTAPANGASYSAGQNVVLTATAADSDGTVTSVDFYAGAVLVGTASSAPYTVTWLTVPAGSYALTAQATDDSGATTTSNTVNITVTPP